MSYPCTKCRGDGILHDSSELQELRTSVGATQEVFADACGWRQSRQSNLESGRGVITSKTWETATAAAKKLAGGSPSVTLRGVIR